MRVVSRYYLLELIVFFVVCAGCEKREHASRAGGVALSFDDRFINEWYQLRPLFLEYGAKVTFYINGDTLKDEEVEMLRQLRDDGHEIGFHGTIHSNAAMLLKHHGVEGYLDLEIWPGLNYLRKLGFEPTSYAHPGGTSTSQTDSALLANGFVTLREVAKAERYFKGIKLYHLPPAWMPHIFWDFDDRKSFYALQIDQETDLSPEEMKTALRKAKKQEKVLLLFGHQPLPDDPDPELYGFKVDFLRQILEEAQKAKLRFFTMSELR